MDNRLQPFYRIVIDNIHKGESYDVTKFVQGDVTIEEEGDYITKMTFTLSHGTFWLAKLLGSLPVTFVGGYLQDPTNRVKTFKGTILITKGIFPGSGFVQAFVTVLGTAWINGGKYADDWVYPSNNASTEKLTVVAPSPSMNVISPVTNKVQRAWANEKGLTLTDIVFNIVTQEMGMKFGSISVGNGIFQPALLPSPKMAAQIFTRTNPLRQYHETDWAFLRRLAKKYGCIMWTEVQDDEDKIFFVDVSYVRNMTRDLTFFYPDRTENGSYSITPKQGDDSFVNPTNVNSNRLQLLDFEVEENMNAVMGITRTVSKYGDTKDPNGDVESQLFVEWDAKSQTYITYELDPAKVDALYKEQPDLFTGSITQNNYLEKYTYSKLIENFFRPVGVSGLKNTDRDFPVIEESFHWKASGNVEGNVNIERGRSYPIEGISKFSSFGESKTTWTILTTTHTFGENSWMVKINFVQ